MFYYGPDLIQRTKTEMFSFSVLCEISLKKKIKYWQLWLAEMYTVKNTVKNYDNITGIT